MKPLILDIGSYALKVGFGGEFAPRLDIPLVMGQIRSDIDFIMKKRIFRELNIRDVKQEYFFGQEAFYLRNHLDLKWLYDGKTILDEFFFSKLFESAMEEANISPANQTVLVTQPFHSNIMTQLGQMLFSTYGIKEIVPAFQPLLNCISGGVQTGLVVDIGFQLTQITPIIIGNIVVDGVRVVDLGGWDITDLLHRLLWDKGSFEGLQESTGISTLGIAEMIKENYGFVSRDPVAAMEEQRRGGGIRFPLLLNESIAVSAERFLGPEVLFGPQEKAVDPLDKLIFDVVSNYDSTIQQALLSNILLTGGTSLLPGLAERLYEELVRRFINYNYKIEITPFAKYGSPRYSVFFGAAKLGAIEIPDSMKISRIDYKRSGIQIPIALLEDFNTIFDQVQPANLTQILISVQNLLNSRLYRQLYNVVNSQRATSVTYLGTKLQRSPLEIYQMLDTLVSYEIIQGEFEEYEFINTQFREAREEVPEYPVRPVQREPVLPAEAPPATPVAEEPYVPSFQRLDAQMPDRVRVDARAPTSREADMPSYERLDAQMPDQVPTEEKTLAAEEEAYMPSFQHLDTQMPDQIRTESPEAGEAEPQYEYTFQKIDDQMKEEWAKDSTILPGEAVGAPRPEPVQEEGYTFERIDKEKAMEWEQDPTIITEGKKAESPRGMVPIPEGYTYEKVDQEKAAEWAREGVVSAPIRVEPKGFFDRIAIPVEEEKAVPTFEKVEKEKAADWAADETVVTREELESKKLSARERLKQLISSEPSYVQAEKEKAVEWEESGLILVPKKPRPRGFFEQPAPSAKPAEDLPTFLRIKDQEMPKPRKTMMADLLKPRTEVTRPAVRADSKLPTYLQGKDLTEEQLRQLRAAEEEDRRRKDKEEKLL